MKNLILAVSMMLMASVSFADVSPEVVERLCKNSPLIENHTEPFKGMPLHLLVCFHDLEDMMSFYSSEVLSIISIDTNPDDNIMIDGPSYTFIYKKLSSISPPASIF